MTISPRIVGDHSLSDQPPLSRLALLRIGEDVHQLVWSIHHVVIDGWCLSLLLHEVLDIYEAIRRGSEPRPRPSRPFRDYVAWLQHRDEKRAESYWRQALSGMTVPTPLGLEGLASNGRSSREYSSERHVRLPAAVTTALQAVARSHQLTLSTLVQGAWSLLLSRYSGAGDVLFGITVSGRPPELPGVESMVGMFINVLPLRVTVTESSYLIPWLRKLQADVVELRRFETIPLSRIRTWSEIPAGMPMFESIVTLQNLPFVTSLQQRADRLGIDSARYLEQTHYPIAVTVLPGTELEIKIAFDAHRFDSAAIDRTLGHLSTLLEAIAADPEQRIDDLPWMTESEQDQLIGRSTPLPGRIRPGRAGCRPAHRGRTRRPDRSPALRHEGKTMSHVEESVELTLGQKRGLVARLLREKAGLKRGGPGLVHRLIEVQAARTPESVAVTCSRGSLTYFELNARANRLAGRLRGMGVGPEVLVGLCTGRSTAMVVGLLAVLKAGGAYVPIDPAYPPDRIAFMLDDACVSVLLTEQRLLDDLPYGNTPVLCLDSEWESVDEGRAGNLDSQVGGANLAYVIYTSGSTGRPKGVQVTHSALANLLQAMRRLLPIGAQDTLLAVTTLSFDIAALEIFLPLIVGGRVELIDRDVAADGARLASLLDDPGDIFPPGDTRHVAIAAGSRLAGKSDTHDALRRRSTPPHAGRSTDRQGGRALEPLWSDRDHGLVFGMPGRGR